MLCVFCAYVLCVSVLCVSVCCVCVCAGPVASRAGLRPRGRAQVLMAHARTQGGGAVRGDCTPLTLPLSLYPLSLAGLAPCDFPLTTAGGISVRDKSLFPSPLMRASGVFSSGFRVSGFQGLGVRTEGLPSQPLCSGFGVWGLGFGVYGLGSGFGLNVESLEKEVEGCSI